MHVQYAVHSDRVTARVRGLEDRGLGAISSDIIPVPISTPTLVVAWANSDALSTGPFEDLHLNQVC